MNLISLPRSLIDPAAVAAASGANNDAHNDALTTSSNRVRSFSRLSQPAKRFSCSANALLSRSHARQRAHNQRSSIRVNNGKFQCPRSGFNIVCCRRAAGRERRRYLLYACLFRRQHLHPPHPPFSRLGRANSDCLCITI